MLLICSHFKNMSGTGSKFTSFRHASNVLYLNGAHLWAALQYYRVRQGCGVFLLSRNYYPDSSLCSEAHVLLNFGSMSSSGNHIITWHIVDFSLPGMAWWLVTASLSKVTAFSNPIYSKWIIIILAKQYPDSLGDRCEEVKRIEENMNKWSDVQLLPVNREKKYSARSLVKRSHSHCNLTTFVFFQHFGSYFYQINRLNCNKHDPYRCFYILGDTWTENSK